MTDPLHTKEPDAKVRVTRPALRGTITFISGCMFSGKTTELLRRLAQHDRSSALAIKHVIDTRYSATQIVSHAGIAHSCRVGRKNCCAKAQAYLPLDVHNAFGGEKI